MSGLSYDEDVIVNLITKVFDLYIQLCYMAKEDVVYPATLDSQDPTARPRHNFPAETYQIWSDLQLSRRVVSLLQRIPCLQNANRRRYAFYEEDCTLASPIDMNLDNRSPPGINQFLLPSEILLVFMATRDGRMLILDTEENTIRVFSLYYDDPDYPQDDDDPRWQEFEYPHVRDHYRNWTAQSAPDFLQHWINDIEELRSIGWFENEDSGEGHFLVAPEDFDVKREITDEELEPMPPGGSFEDRFDEVQIKRFKYLKRTMGRDYGWPDNFEAERWMTEHKSVWKQVASRYDYE